MIIARNGLFHLLFNPKHQEVHDLFLPGFAQFYIFGYLIPLVKTVTAAAGAGVLGYEHGMPAHGRLASVVWNHGGGKTSFDKISTVAFDRFKPLFVYILPIFFT